MKEIKQILFDIIDIVDDLRMEMSVVEKIRIGDKIHKTLDKLHDIKEAEHD